jgi:hypothetical protein
LCQMTPRDRSIRTGQSDKSEIVIRVGEGHDCIAVPVQLSGSRDVSSLTLRVQLHQKF